MDVLYPLGTGSNYRNLELRFSLRSLINVDHDRIFLIGPLLPRWIQNISYIKFDDKPLRKQINVINKILFMCRPDSGLSEDFILMNDDFYFLKKQELKNYIMDLSLQDLFNKHPKSSYGLAVHTTITYLKKNQLPELNYEIHYPFIINKKKFLELFSKIDSKEGAILYRSIYGNTYQLPGEMREDFKFYDPLDFYNKKGELFFSSDNIIPCIYDFKQFMLKLFPDRCIHEAALKYEKI